jgi:hypothetical protein
MGLQGWVKRIGLKLHNFFSELSLQLGVLMDPFFVNLFEPLIPDEFNHSDPPGDLLPYRFGTYFSLRLFLPALPGEQ